MIIVGAAMNHWYHNDMNYRGLINMLIMCGCVGQTGGGWAHYVGQEKLRPQSGWTPLAFGLDWSKPPRQMNGTLFFYFNLRFNGVMEKLDVSEIISPLADPKKYSGSLVDFNLRAVRMVGCSSAPQLNINPLNFVREAEAQASIGEACRSGSWKSGALEFAYADPDVPQSFDATRFILALEPVGFVG